MEESDFYGISGMKETVCLSHITDDVLRDALGGVADKFECSFCPRTSERSTEPFAVAMDELGTRVWDVVTWLYQWTDGGGDPWQYDEEYDDTYVVYETVEEAIDPAYAMQVVECLIAATSSSDSWIPSDSIDPSMLGWDAYSATVRTESRFVFIGASDRPGFEEEPPRQNRKVPRIAACLRRVRPGGGAVGRIETVPRTHDRRCSPSARRSAR